MRTTNDTNTTSRQAHWAVHNSRVCETPRREQADTIQMDSRLDDPLRRAEDNKAAVRIRRGDIKSLARRLGCATARTGKALGDFFSSIGYCIIGALLIVAALIAVIRHLSVLSLIVGGGIAYYGWRTIVFGVWERRLQRMIKGGKQDNTNHN